MFKEKNLKIFTSGFNIYLVGCSYLPLKNCFRSKEELVEHRKCAIGVNDKSIKYQLFKKTVHVLTGNSGDKRRASNRVLCILCVEFYVYTAAHLIGFWSTKKSKSGIATI